MFTSHVRVGAILQSNIFLKQYHSSCTSYDKQAVNIVYRISGHALVDEPNLVNLWLWYLYLKDNALESRSSVSQASMDTFLLNSFFTGLIYSHQQ